MSAKKYVDLPEKDMLKDSTGLVSGNDKWRSLMGEHLGWGGSYPRVFLTPFEYLLKHGEWLQMADNRDLFVPNEEISLDIGESFLYHSPNDWNYKLTGEVFEYERDKEGIGLIECRVGKLPVLIRMADLEHSNNFHLLATKQVSPAGIVYPAKISNPVLKPLCTDDECPKTHFELIYYLNIDTVPGSKIMENADKVENLPRFDKYQRRLH